MEYWWTEEQWADFIRRRHQVESRLISQVCSHVRNALNCHTMALDILECNRNQFNKDDDDNPLTGRWSLYDGEYGSVGKPIIYCPWCGNKLPDVPKMYIGR